MSFLEILLQVGTVFLGAFLAFGLENFRERRQLRAWANEYLGRVREDLLEDGEDTRTIRDLEERVTDYATFTALDKDHVPNEDEWNSLMKLFAVTHRNYHALLESTAVRVLPAELVKALAELDEHRREDEIMTDLCSTAWQQYTVPLVLQQTPITDVERRGLEYTQGFFKLRLESVRKRLETGKRVLELLDRHNLGR